MSLDNWLEIEVDTGGPKLHTVELFSSNITSNLTEMAMEAGVYICLWHPENLGGKVTANQLIEPLQKGLKKLKSQPEHYKKFDSPNKWGIYDDFVPFVEKVLEACKEHPKSFVRVWI